MEIGPHLLVFENNDYFCLCTRGVRAFSLFYYNAFSSHYFKCSALWLRCLLFSSCFDFLILHLFRCLCFIETSSICVASVKRKIPLPLSKIGSFSTDSMQHINMYTFKLLHKYLYISTFQKHII